MCMPYVCGCLQRPEEGTGSPELGLQEAINRQSWVLVRELRSGKNKQVLMTIEPSLQVHHPRFAFTFFPVRRAVVLNLWVTIS